MNPRGAQRSDRGDSRDPTRHGSRRSDEGWTIWCKSAAIENRLPDSEPIGDEDAVGLPLEEFVLPNLQIFAV